VISGVFCTSVALLFLVSPRYDSEFVEFLLFAWVPIDRANSGDLIDASWCRRWRSWGLVAARLRCPFDSLLTQTRYRDECWLPGMSCILLLWRSTNSLFVIRSIPRLRDEFRFGAQAPSEEEMFTAPLAAKSLIERESLQPLLLIHPDASEDYQRKTKTIGSKSLT